MTNGQEDLGGGLVPVDDPLNGPLTGPLGPAPLAAGPLGGPGPLGGGPGSGSLGGPGSLGSGSLGGGAAGTLGALRAPGRRDAVIGRDSLLGEPYRAIESYPARDLPIEGDREPSRRNGAIPPLELPPLPALTAMPEMSDLSEPVFDPPSWLESTEESLADHPLLRGLLLELPPKGSAMPTADWLNRWFEALRSILELLYSANKGR